MDFNEFLSNLDPKDAKAVKTASEVRVEKIPLASRRLTNALGGGIAKGKITTIYGNYSAGKTMLTLQSMAKWQELGLICGFIDCEGTLDGAFAERLGVNTNQLVVDGSKSSSKVEKIMNKWMKAGIDVIATDSISDIMPEVFVDERTGELGENRKQIGAHAKAITNLINGIHYVNEKTAVILLSQTTTKMEQTYVKQVPHGGNKVGFGSTTMIRLTSSNTDAKQKKGLVRRGDILEELPIGRTVDAFVEKNKAGPQHRVASYDIYYDGDFIGIDAAGELADMCLDFGIINKGGAWFKLDESRKWQGRDTLVSAIRNDSDLEIELEAKIQEAISG